MNKKTFVIYIFDQIPKMLFFSDFPLQKQNQAEQIVLQALQKLGDSFDAFYNKSFARKYHKKVLLSEVDFWVFDLCRVKRNNPFVIEIKGGKMAYNGDLNKESK